MRLDDDCIDAGRLFCALVRQFLVSEGAEMHGSAINDCDSGGVLSTSFGPLSVFVSRDHVVFRFEDLDKARDALPRGFFERGSLRQTYYFPPQWHVAEAFALVVHEVYYHLRAYAFPAHD